MKKGLLLIDWLLFFAVVPILAAGLVTMNSFMEKSAFFERQLLWIGVSFAVFFVFSYIDFRFLKRTGVLVTLFLGTVLVLLSLFVMGQVSKGAQSWFRIGFFSVEPSDPAQIVVILLLSKYFSRRHIEIRNIRHIIISGLYAFVICLLILVQPDFGGAIIIFFIWFGMVLVSGLSRKHIAAVVLIGAIAFMGLWGYVLKPYQKDRIKTFVNPLGDIHGAGYNAYQSTIAVGSGQLLGKGVGYGTQSKLNFLPEYRTDFIFAAFAEEWGFVGVVIIFSLYGIVIWRILASALHGASNFEILYGLGVAIFLSTHFIINVGMNIGLLPVTGVTIPFMSYGGSHLVTEFAELTPNKGLSYAIKSMQNVPEALYVIIGKGELEEELRMHIHRLNLTNVHMTGFISNAQELLKAFDIFLLPSLKEGLPYVLLEAGSAGIPVVATSVGGIPEIITHNKTGLLVPPAHEEAMAEALVTLTHNHNLQQELGQNLKKKIQETFTFETMLDKTLALYK